MGDAGRALFEEVCERVDDDAVRLVYADWLDEHGDPERARAIRLGVERRKLDDIDPRAWVIDSQLRQLHERHGAAWTAGVRKPKGARAVELSGGLVTKATVDSVEVLKKHEDRLFALGPIADLGVVVTAADDAKAVAACRHAGRLHSLRFSSEHWGEVEGLGAVLEADGLRGLCELGIADFHAEQIDIRQLAKARPARLHTLELNDVFLDEADCRALGAAPFVSALRSLRLVQPAYRALPIPTLLQGEGWRGLRRFTGRDFITRDSLNDFPFTTWTELEVLDLSGNRLGATASRQLAGAPWQRLRYLALSNCTRVGDKGMRALASSPHLGNLRVLKVDYCGLDRKGIEALAGASWLGGLTSLSVGGCYESAAVCDVLATAPLGSLRRLELVGAGLTDSSVKALLSAPWLPALTHLNLAANRITGKGALALAASLPGETLVELELTNNRFSRAEQAALREMFGDRVRL